MQVNNNPMFGRPQLRSIDQYMGLIRQVDVHKIESNF